jgi:hypothetical protein
MGDYIYALRSPKLARKIVVHFDNPVLEDAEVLAGSMSYLFKPYATRWTSGKSEFDAPYIRILARLEKLWRGVSKRPVYAVFTEHKKGHKIEVGQLVYIFYTESEWYKGVPYEYNDGSEHAHIVGVVKEIIGV